MCPCGRSHCETVRGKGVVVAPRGAATNVFSIKAGKTAELRLDFSNVGELENWGRISTNDKYILTAMV